ncbi:hypothetical protein CUJ84_pRLN3000236 (plasmid) [Rhizobium leguminosarum]|uniref:Uncharacterized protein n=1 Tax=Rhizobium leguminosarum TaxID=384 RepID=A0A2K9ZGH4_RHILE|nr:hypothetical protein CUJ84_pRLN3000236 [Rhizobium leguminosarum]
MPWCLAADGFRACAVKHAIENGSADGDFGLLTRPRPGPQTPPDDDFYRPIAVSTSERLP